MIKVIHIGKAFIQIIDEEENVEIYNGSNEIDCVIEAMSLYFGEDGVEYEEKEVPKAHDPLDASTDSLRKNKEKDVEQIEIGEEGGQDNVVYVDQQRRGETPDNPWEDDDE